MNEDTNILKLYDHKVKGIGFLIPIAIFTGLTILVLFFAEGENDARIFLSLFLTFFNALFIWEFYSKNKANKNAVFIKENGYSFSGTVLHIYIHRTSKKNKIIRHLLVKFNDGTQDKVIVTPHFPYYIKTNTPDLITKKVNTDEYNNSYIVNHTQYMGNGYITFNKTEPKMKPHVYYTSANKNFEEDITCKVFVYKDKYVIDDFEGLNLRN